MQGTDPFLPPAASGGDSENAAPAGQERRAAPQAAVGPGPRSPGSPGPPPAPPPPGSRPSPAGRGRPRQCPGRPSPRKPLGWGGRRPSFLPRQICAKGAPSGGGPSPSPPGSSPEVPLPDPTLPPHPTFLRLGFPISLPLLWETGCRGEGAQGREGGMLLQGPPWLTARKGPCTQPPVSDAITVI